MNYKENVEISLANAGEWLTPADVGAMTLLVRLAGMVDTLLDMGETKDLAPLVSRVQSLMNDLRLTPGARDVETPGPVKEVKNGEQFAQDYLRLVNASGGDNATQVKKPRTNSGGPNGKPRRTDVGVAKARPRPGTGD